MWQVAGEVRLQRIDALEFTGTDLVVALDRQDWSDDSDSDDEAAYKEEMEAEILAAQAAFRGALEDETFYALRYNWEDLLRQ